MDWLKDVAKVLPVEEIYKDVAQPAVREVGDALQKAVKAARWVLAPVECLAAQHGRWIHYLQRVADKVPEERRMEALPQLVGPVFEGLRYVDEENIVAELFVNLLARAIDKERVNEAHPAFAQTISQLSPDEAMILFFLKKKSLSCQFYPKGLPGIDLRGAHTYGPDFPTKELVCPYNITMYIDHLKALYLAKFSEDKETIAAMGDFIPGVIELTPFGGMFARACIPDELPV